MEHAGGLSELLPSSTQAWGNLIVFLIVTFGGGIIYLQKLRTAWRTVYGEDKVPRDRGWSDIDTIRRIIDAVERVAKNTSEMLEMMEDRNIKESMEREYQRGRDKEREHRERDERDGRERNEQQVRESVRRLRQHNPYEDPSNS